jgi:Ca2+-transporting ATPase
MTGLTTAEAERRLAERGPNRPPEPRPRPLRARVWSQVRDPMILLLLGAGVLTAALHETANTAIIAAVVVFNTLTGVVQEVRADHAVAALADLTPATSQVRRDGVVTTVPAADLVPGDEVLLAAGDLVPGDGDLTTARDLEVDESTMTGESLPVPRSTGDPVTGGTLVTRGRGVLTLTRTGPDSGLGRLAALIDAAPVRATPLQNRLTQVSRVLVVIVVALTAVVVAIGLAQGRSLADMAVLGVSLAVAAVPESLPAVVAVALALGAHRMAARQAVVRRLPAVETLGSVTVIATDKTGTITQGRMVAERAWTPGADHVLDGDGDLAAGEGVVRLLRDVVLCNDARLPGADDGPVPGDPLEVALLVLADRAGLVREDVDGTWPRTGEEAFDAATRRMVTTHRGADGAELTVCKGAPEVVLALVAPGPDVRGAAAAADELAGEGYRVIAVADRTARAGEPGGGYTLAGLVAVDDPPRTHAAAVVAACRRAGIRLVLVTGDHPGTARAIAARVGIGVGDGVRTTGATVAESVYARVRPEQKVEIVEALQGQGEVVAMLGDGVNDAPALRRADIGVAAGLGGTEVARQAADMVLLDDDLSTVVAAVEEGRRIYANIRAFLMYAVSGGLAEVAVMLDGPVVGIAQPLLAAQILWINLLTHGLTGVAFGSEPADPREMSRPPRPPTQSVFTPRFSTHLVIASVVLTVTALLVGGGVPGPVEDQRTAVFLTLGLGQLAVAWGIRSRPARTGGHRTTSWWGLRQAVLGAAVLMLLGTVLVPLQALLGTSAPSAAVAGVAVLAACVPGGVMRVLVNRERERDQVVA